MSSRVAILGRAPLTCVLLLATASVGRTQPTPAPAPARSATPAETVDDRPGASVEIGLDDAVIGSRLPFDVPFFFTGTPPSEVTDIDMIGYEARRKAPITEAVLVMRKAGSCDVKSDVVQRISVSAWSGTQKSTQFQILVDALEPQRYYLFCFTLRGPVPQDEILPLARAAVAEIVEATVAGVGGDVTLDTARAIQERFSEAVRQIGARRARPAVPPVGNLFHQDTVVQQGDTFVELLIGLRDPYRLLVAIAKEYEDAEQELQKRVEAAKASLPDGLVATLQASSARSLPAPSTGITETTPFNFSRHNFADTIDALNEAADAARLAGNVKGASEITPVARQLRVLQGRAAAFGKQFDGLRAAVASLLEHIALETRQIRVQLGSSVLSADLARNTYVSLDAGVAYPWQLESMVMYAGTNIYFRPINKNAPLREKGSFGRRFALTVGLTTTVDDASRRASDLRPTDGADTTSNSLLLGGGLRITPSIRVGAGALIFKESDPNPLITQKSVAFTPYVALALDVDVGAAIQKFFPKN